MRAPEAAIDLQLIRAGVNAVRQRQPFRQEADVVQVADDALRIIPVGPGALVDRLQQVA